MQTFSLVSWFLGIQTCLLAPVLATAQPSASCAAGPALDTTTTTPALNVTAINGVNGHSVLECWQLGPFATTNTPGVIGSLSLFLGDASNATYSVLPPRFNGGVHTAPAVQYVWFTAGLAHVTLPNSTDEAWVQGGKYGLIIAADTPDVSKSGHITTYPSDSDTVAIQVPLKDGVLPKHSVLHAGACAWSEMVGI